ncbi:TonB-dependent receptor [Exilibacterium tricleocarpae]|nr:TonB-dependent receptor [Exilibacterium tricleocarpae]
MKKTTMTPTKLGTAIRWFNTTVLAYGSLGALAAVGTVNTAHAQPAAAAAGAAPIVEELEVIGIRGSLRRALAVKENADAVVDAINAEDIGKFPDKNVADSLQRIPGISVDRIWGEGRDIFVRGTNSEVNRTLLNGQNVASAFWWANDNPSRGFNYSILASELVSSLEVYKSPQADLDEGSIGGTVIVRTRRPMDLEPLTLRGSVEGQYSELPDEWDPQTSALLSWKNAAETFAVLGSFNRQERSVRRDGLEAFPTNTLYDVTDQNGAVTEDVYAVWGGGSAIFQQQRERDTTNLTLQWRPTSAWDAVFNYVNSDMGMDNSNQNYLFVTGGFKLANGDTVTNPVFIPTSDGRQALVGGTIENPASVGVADEPIYRDAFIESTVYDLDVTYTGDGWQAHVQTGFTEAEGGSTHDRNYWFEGNTREVINLSANTNEFSFPDIDPLDGRALALQPGSLRDWIRIMEDDEFYLQGDLEIDVNWGPVTSLKVGGKWRDHTIENNRRVGSIDIDDPAIAAEVAALAALTLDDLSSGPSPRLHGETASSGSLTRYAFLDRRKAIQQVDTLLNAGVMSYAVDQNAFYDINEEITAWYAKASFEQGELRGNIGLRAVQTDQTSKAFQDGALATVTRDYTEYLPSVNLAYNLRDDLIVRGAIATVMARPTFQNLSANLVINATTGTASGGNPLLDITTADQFEVGIEWYYDEAAIVSATYFVKDLSTFIVNRTQTEDFNGQTLTVTRPFNADGADIQGLELQLQHPLGRGFGITANYTYTDADVAREVGRLELPGNSENQANASIYYEDDRFSARLSYNYRSESFGTLVSGSQIATDDYDQWDATFTWQATNQVDIFLSAVNITNEVIYQSTSDGIPVGFYENGSRFSLGARLQY